MLGMLEFVLVDVEAALRLSSPDPGLREMQARALIDLDRLDEALAILDACLGPEPGAGDDAGLCFVRALLNHRLGRHPESVADLQRSFELDGQSVAHFLELGWFFRREGHFEAALSGFEAAVKVAPHLADGHTGCGDCLVRLDRVAEALPHFATATEIDPDDVRAWTGRGHCLARLGRLEEALPCFRRAREIAPDDWFPVASEGQVLKSLGRFRESMESYRRAIELNGEDAELHKMLGGVYGRLGMNREARASWERAFSLEAATPDGAEGAPGPNRAPPHLATIYLMTSESIDDVRQAVRLDQEYLSEERCRSLEQSMREHVPPEEWPTWERRWAWLRQVIDESRGGADPGTSPSS
jgi:tetratricopeptide (TPR) repeat protein